MHTHPLSKKIGLFAGPLLFITVLNFPFGTLSFEATAVLATALWMVSWWISEAVSISVTALLPLIILVYTFFRDDLLNGDILKAGMVVGSLLSIIALIALWKLKETFHTDLDFIENEH